MGRREQSAAGEGAARRAGLAGGAAGLLAGAALTALAAGRSPGLRVELAAEAEWLLAASAGALFLAGLAFLGKRLRSAWRAGEALAEERRALERDIAAHQQLEAAHARLAQAVDQAAEGIALTDPGGRLEYLNPAFQRITGFGPGELRAAAELDDVPADGEA